MIDPETGGPHTAHTTYDVPLIVVEPGLEGTHPADRRQAGRHCAHHPGIDGVADPSGDDGRAFIEGARPSGQCLTAEPSDRSCPLVVLLASQADVLPCGQTIRFAQHFFAAGLNWIATQNDLCFWGRATDPSQQCFGTQKDDIRRDHHQSESNHPQEQRNSAMNDDSYRKSRSVASCAARQARSKKFPKTASHASSR